MMRLIGGELRRGVEVRGRISLPVFVHATFELVYLLELPCQLAGGGFLDTQQSKAIN